MDEHEEIAKFKWMLVIGIVFLVSACYSLNEFRYLIFGKTIEATLTRAYETTVSGRRGRRHQEQVFEYQFSEPGGAIRNERDQVSLGWPNPSNGKIAIQYIPGVEKASRLVGHSFMIAVYIFLACCAGLGYGLYQLILLANDEPKSYKPKPKRKKVRRPIPEE